MRIRVLGSTSVDGTEPLTGRDSKVLAALAAGFPDAVAAGSLAEAVWGSSPPASWEKVLQGSVSRLRRVCGAATIVTQLGGYRLVVDATAIDACRFQMLVDRASSVLHSDLATAVRALDEADELWRGEPFVALGRMPGALDAVSRLEGCRRTADALRVEVLLAAGRLDDAVAVASALSAREPYDERRASLLVSALYRSGRPVDALNAVRAAVQRLRDDLGLEPGSELVELELAVLRRDVSLVGPTSVTPRPTIPLGGEAFIGRVDEVAALHAALRPGGVVTVVGVGGAGKTRLASHVAAAKAAMLHVVTVELSSVEGEGVVAAVARAAGAATPGADVYAAVEQAVSDRPLLLVLDNCEHVRHEAADLIARLIDASTSLMVLSTSRQPLGLEGERVLRIDGLGDDAQRLFEERARARGCGDELARSPAVSDLCERLGGLPLALELAASRTPALSPLEILRHLDADAALLSEENRTRHARHRSLAAVFEWSHDLLEPDERLVLDVLTVPPGGATLAALEAIVSDAVDGGVATAIGGLVDASIVQRARDPDGASRYRIHPALAPAARMRRMADLAQLAQKRLVDWASAWCETASAGLVSPDESRWRAALHAERLNIAEAIRLAIAQRRPAAAAALCRCVGSEVVHSLDLEATAWYRDTVAACRGHDVPDAADAAATLSMLQWLAGAAPDAAQAALEVEAMPEASRSARALALHVRGLAGNDATLVEESVRVADTTENMVMATSFRLPLVMALAATAPRDARTRAAEAWELAARSGNPTAIASAQLSAGTVSLATDASDAQRHFEVVRAIAVETGNRILAVMVDVLATMGGERAPLESLTAALDAAASLRDRGARVQSGMALLRAADVLAGLGDLQTASTLVRAVRRAGLEDWRSWRPVLRLDHLPVDIDAAEFPPMPLDLDAAIDLGRQASGAQRSI